MIALALAMALQAAPVPRSSPAVLSALDGVMRCYRDAAEAAGRQSCASPSELVGAVFGSCMVEESRLRSAIQSNIPTDYDSANAELAYTRQAASNGVQAVVLRSQAGRWCGRTP